ncbi:DNA polymerase III subunit delta [Holospora curviuscula]|uniref:DNA polymerase III subunit delta n=1 Tax=Holospora curviuscula TaxID=1082868 RepID=A0A2S5R863_9PROT|nr:DNA polymerase III subunit delta [Holospora curviuscula]
MISEYNDIVSKQQFIKKLLINNISILRKMDTNNPDVQGLLTKMIPFTEPINSGTTLDKILEVNVISKLKGKKIL